MVVIVGEKMIALRAIYCSMLEVIERGSEGMFSITKQYYTPGNRKASFSYFLR